MNNDMTRARSWAKEILEWKGWAPSAHVLAAARLIDSLPDKYIDSEKLREITNAMQREIDDAENEKWFTNYHDSTRDWKEELEALLPSPALLAEVKMGSWANHITQGKVLIVSTAPSSTGHVQICKGHEGHSHAIFSIVKHEDLSPLGEEEPRAATTEEEYDELPVGSIIESQNPAHVWVKKEDGDWYLVTPPPGTGVVSGRLAGETRRVLREGWSA